MVKNVPPWHELDHRSTGGALTCGKGRAGGRRRHKPGHSGRHPSADPFAAPRAGRLAVAPRADAKRRAPGPARGGPRGVRPARPAPPRCDRHRPVRAGPLPRLRPLRRLGRGPSRRLGADRALLRRGEGRLRGADRARRLGRLADAAPVHQGAGGGQRRRHPVLCCPAPGLRRGDGRAGPRPAAAPRLLRAPLLHRARRRGGGGPLLGHHHALPAHRRPHRRRRHVRERCPAPERRDRGGPADGRRARGAARSPRDA